MSCPRRASKCVREIRRRGLAAVNTGGKSGSLGPGPGALPDGTAEPLRVGGGQRKERQKLKH